MTKAEEIYELLVNEEKERYLRYRYFQWVYVSSNVPFGYGYVEYEEKLRYSDARVSELRGKWYSLYDILDSMDILASVSKEAQHYFNMTYNWLEGIKQ